MIRCFYHKAETVTYFYQHEWKPAFKLSNNIHAWGGWGNNSTARIYGHEKEEDGWTGAYDKSQSCRGIPGSVSRQSALNLRCTAWHWYMFPSKQFGFPMPLPFHQCLILNHAIRSLDNWPITGRSSTKRISPHQLLQENWEIIKQGVSQSIIFDKYCQGGQIREQGMAEVCKPLWKYEKSYTGTKYCEN
jgi:hypothetical protein